MTDEAILKNAYSQYTINKTFMSDNIAQLLNMMYPSGVPGVMYDMVSEPISHNWMDGKMECLNIICTQLCTKYLFYQVKAVYEDSIDFVPGQASWFWFDRVIKVKHNNNNSN
jgi:hypothetical protein